MELALEGPLGPRLAEPKNFWLREFDIVAAVASFVPPQHAAGVDPVVALRHE